MLWERRAMQAYMWFYTRYNQHLLLSLIVFSDKTLTIIPRVFEQHASTQQHAIQTRDHTHTYGWTYRTARYYIPASSTSGGITTPNTLIDDIFVMSQTQNSLLTQTTVAGVKCSSVSVCLSVCLSVRSITQKRIISLQTSDILQFVGWKGKN